MTKTGRAWLSAATAGLRADQGQALADEAQRISDLRRSPRIGGNHVLEALLETRLYQRTAP